MTFRHALLPVGGLLVLGLGVYLFVEVRAQPAPPVVARAAQTEAPGPGSLEPPAGAEARMQRPTAPPHAAAAAQPVPIRPVDPVPAPRDVAPQDDSAPLTGPRLSAVMDDANKAYDRGDFEDAKQIAGRVLAQDPVNVRMLRIVVSASCIEGDTAVAQSAFAKLPWPDQEQMRIRCARYGIAFAEK